MQRRKYTRRRGGRALAARPVTAWWRPGSFLTSALSAGQQNTDLVVLNAQQLIPQPAAVLDRKTFIKVLRIIARIVLLVTGGGNAGNYTFDYGFRSGDTTASGGVASGASPAMPNDPDRREDWWWRDGQTVSIGAADANTLTPLGKDGGNELRVDFKPNRKVEFGQAVIFSIACVPLGSFGGGTTMVARCDFMALVAGVS